MTIKRLALGSTYAGLLIYQYVSPDPTKPTRKRIYTMDVCINGALYFPKGYSAAL